MTKEMQRADSGQTSLPCSVSVARCHPPHSTLAQSKERKGSNFAAQRSGAIVLQARRAKHIQSRNLAIAIWQPCPDYLGGVFPQHSAIFLPRRRRLMCARTPILRCRAGRKIVFSQAIDSFSKIQLFLSWSAYHTDCPNDTFFPH